MISSVYQLNNTQIFGLFAFGFAGFVCLWAAFRHNKSRGIWILLFAGHFIMFVETVALTRFVIKSIIMGRFASFDDYVNLKTGLAMAIFIAVFSVGFFIVRLSMPARNLVPSVRLALLAGGLILALYLLEVISLHAIDAVLYWQIGPVLLVGWLWLVLGLASAAAAFRAARAPGQAR